MRAYQRFFSLFGPAQAEQPLTQQKITSAKVAVEFFGIVDQGNVLLKRGYGFLDALRRRVCFAKVEIRRGAIGTHARGMQKNSFSG